MSPKPKTNRTPAQELAKAHQALREYESILNLPPDIINNKLFFD